MKLRASTKIAIGAIGLAALGFLGYNVYAAYRVDRLQFAPLQPGKVNIVAVNPGSGYRIIVSNSLAQLVEASEAEFQSASGSEGAGSNPKRIPLDALLMALQGDEEALSELVIQLNDLDSEELPPQPKIWQAEDVAKAIEGDATLARALEQDIASTLDGRPIPSFTTRAIVDGIVIMAPVKVEVRVGGELKQLEARVPRPFQSRIANAVWKEVEELPEIDQVTLAGYYREQARILSENPTQAEDVRLSLKNLIDPERLQSYAEAPEKVLVRTEIVVNDDYIENAGLREYEGGRGEELYDISVRLSDEGRLRLWKFSRQQQQQKLRLPFLPSREEKTGQLLLIVDGIAIAAPKISGEISQRNVLMTQLRDRVMVDQAVLRINEEGLQGEQTQ